MRRTSLNHTAVASLLLAQILLSGCAQGPEPPSAAAPAAAVMPSPADAERGIPEHPRLLEYPPLEFTPPDREAHRHPLPSGVVVYVVEDRTLPLVDVEVLIRAGSYLEPPALAGLAAAVGSQLRAGGTRSLDPETLDEELAFLAAEVSSSIGETEGTASFNCLSRNLDRVLDLFFEMLRAPGFDRKQLDLYRSQTLQALERRNDSTGSIESREWTRLLRGKNHFTADRVTKATIEAITRETMLDFHRRHVHPGNFVIAVSGDVAAGEILAKLSSKLEGWEVPGAEQPPIPGPARPPSPGLYLVDKPDVNQSRVAMGHPAVRREHPDYHALLIANHILGGGGFVSRITSRVRSDEGLAYTARSAYDFGVYYDGIFRAFLQTRNAAVAQAIEIVREEIARMRSEPVTEAELSSAISYYQGMFPRFFATPSQVASTFAEDELTGRSHEFWTTFREKLGDVTAADVLRVSKEHFRLEDLVILVVGQETEVLAGNPERPQFSVEKLAGEKGVQRIPLPDPLSLEYGS